MGLELFPAPRGFEANGSFFTYFSEFRSPDHLLPVSVETAVLVLVFLVSLMTNACMTGLVIKGKKLVNFQCLVLNLFLADIVFVGVIPVILAVRWTESWTLGAIVCHALFYVMALSGGVTIITLAAISIERSISILQMRLKAPLHCKSVTAVVLTIWVFSALTSLPLCIHFQVMTIHVKDQEHQICTLVWPNTAQEIIWDLSYGLFNFTIPGLIIVISYTKILKVSAIHSSDLVNFLMSLEITKAARKKLQARRPSSENQRQIRVSKQDYWLFRTLLILMTSFFIMWTPISLIIFLLLVQNFKRDLFLTSTLFFWVCAFTFTNSALNPILYGATQFRGEWQRLLCFFHFKSRDKTATEHANTNVRIQESQPAPSVICD
ncbi:free fatty acid receptor 4-like [Scyliorhinus canicula]|uniref:free fatty acid receptor 4-like n=1 Tax=Scyliorhinus canicula TaxID=7830 RepID=UPI0018F669B6|nr:free fatty acid receptor 4-like [Scyliorhinus canicula]